MSNLLRPLALFAALQLGLHGLAWACSCGEPPAVADAAADADLVVFGTVESVSGRGPRLCGSMRSDDAIRVEIAVEEAWKGANAGETVTVETAISDASCGVDFAEGESWLVYATQGEARLCSRTRLADADDPELEELDRL